GSGGIDHHHDMWNGQTRIILFEEAAMMEPGASIDFQPPQSRLIYEGTASIEFTISDPERRVCEPIFTLGGDFVCSDNAVNKSYGFATGRAPEGTLPSSPPADGVPRAPDPTGGPPGLLLRYKHASTVDWIDVGPLAWGTPTVLKITDPRQTDMPHATSSLWEFQVTSPNAQDATLTFTAKAEMVRGEGVIPLWPGHPDFYAERSFREVLNIPDAEACDSGLSNTGCLTADDEKTGEMAPTKLISYGTKTLHVWVNITEATMTNPATAPQNWFLYHLNATGRTNLTNPFDPEAPIDKLDHYWILPVDDNAMDSPYADGSRWSFQLGASITTPALACYGGCAEWSAKFGIVVIATNEELPFESYHYSCLRDEECPTS
ncbi:MAG: hypothetical protein ABIO65_01800, partial [Nitrospiria bacterium]